MILMRYTTPLLGVAAFLALTASISAQSVTGSNPVSPQMVKHFRFTKTQSAELDYLLFLPKGYDAGAEKRWPMILFLHGAGERGTNVWQVAVHGPPKNVATHPDFPFIVVSPQCPADHVWSKEVLLGLLNEITAAYAVDTRRIYLTGLSMGGYGTWDLGLAHPKKFAAIVPICGGGQTLSVLLVSPDKVSALKTLGVWAFHGAKDPVVSPSESQRMVDALKKAGVEDVKLTVYPEAGHDSWTESYNNPELYDWLLKHQRKP
jgi:predicted peptidase